MKPIVIITIAVVCSVGAVFGIFLTIDALDNFTIENQVKDCKSAIHSSVKLEDDIRYQEGLTFNIDITGDPDVTKYQRKKMAEWKTELEQMNHDYFKIQDYLRINCGYP